MRSMKTAYWRVAYRGEEWKEFRRFFDARTTLYDYTGVPLFEMNETFYETNNIGEIQYKLLDNYNYGLDAGIDAAMMENVAEYAEGIQAGFFERLKMGLFGLGNGIKTTEEQIVQIEEHNVGNAALMEYSAQHPDDFFFIDVYSSIYFTEKVFTRQYPGENRELLGGWICNSPLYDKKLQAYGMTSAEEGFARYDNVFLVQSEESTTDWLVAYYESKGCRIKITEEKKLDGGLVIYSLKIN